MLSGNNSSGSLKRLRPNAEIASDEHVLDNQLALIETGLCGSESDFKRKKNENGEIVYIFSYGPCQSQKSRLELTTSFVDESTASNVPEAIKSLLKTGKPTRLQTFSRAANLPMDAVHSYNYDLYLCEDSKKSLGKFIISQWHGSPDPRVVRDSQGYIAKISDKDLEDICKTNAGKKGSFTPSTGFNYQQGGYPPLSLHMEEGKLMVFSRSDARYFKPKKGCSKNTAGQCEDAQQQVHQLWETPLKEALVRKWNNFEWKIKWSDYKYMCDAAPNSDPGVLVSKAWIRLWVNKIQVIDWIGPCGRNEQGRVPFFKFGIYNPSSSSGSLLLKFKNLECRHQKTSLVGGSEKERIAGLKVRSNLNDWSSEDRLCYGGKNTTLVKMMPTKIE